MVQGVGQEPSQEMGRGMGNGMSESMGFNEGMNQGMNLGGGMGVGAMRGGQRLAGGYAARSNGTEKLLYYYSFRNKNGFNLFFQVFTIQILRDPTGVVGSRSPTTPIHCSKNPTSSHLEIYGAPLSRSIYRQSINCI